jgi:hypothetical protein
MGTIGTLGRRKERQAEVVTERTSSRRPERSISTDGQTEERPPRAARRARGRPAGRSRVGRWTSRQVVEEADGLTLRMLRAVMSIRGQPLTRDRDHVVIGLDGKQWKIGLAWRERVLRGRTAGARPYFRCACGRRCVALFPSDRGPICRVCTDLTYRSRTISARRRQISRVLKIREQLGCPCTTAELLAQGFDGGKLRRPKGMKRSVFELWAAKHWRAWARVKVHQIRLTRSRKHPAWRF